MTDRSSSYFEQAFDHVVQIEGGFSNSKNDLGGATRYGITESVAREEGYMGAMKELPLEFAKTIYRRRYWDSISLDDIAAISYPISLELFDTGVNMGVSIGVTFLQRSLNALNREQGDYADIRVDGAIGARTVEALRSYFAKRTALAAPVLLKALNCLQGARYIELSEKREANQTYTFGWLSNRISLT
jgi:lysozyme family protein